MDFLIREAGREDMESFLALLQIAHAHLENKEWLYLDDPEEFREMMDDGSMKLWVAMDGNRLAAAFDILIPGMDPYNYGFDLGFDEEMLLATVNMDTIVVHPDYRGHGLMRTLMTEAEMWAGKHGYKYLTCTVHPENSYSLNNMLALGYRIQRTMPKYGSLRHVLRKDIPSKNNF